MRTLFRGLLAVLFLAAGTSWLHAQVNVTFQVDMSEQTVDPSGVHVAGAFQGWDAAATPLADQGGGIWAVTVAIAEGTVFEYKFINGNAWGLDESVPAECAVNGNREWTVGLADETIPLVCYGSCLICSPPTSNITFQVDMSQETLDPAGVHVAGAFQGWDPAGTPLTDQGGGIWSVTLALDQGASYEYKYINGNAWGLEETVPAECNSNTNRILTVGTSDETLALVCYGSCSECVTGGTPGCTDATAQNYDPAATIDDGSCAYLVTFEVDMNNVCIDANGAHIAGAFQGWDPAATPMSDTDMDGVWTYTTTIANGNYEYKYLNGNAWGQDESIPAACNVNGNREVIVAGADLVVPVHCFASCDPCGAPADVTLTLQVDMSEQVVDAAGVHIAGTFNGWDPAATPMTDIGGGLYSVDVQVPSGSTVQYRFVNGNLSAGEETVPVECGSDDGSGTLARTIDCIDAAQTVDPICFASCGACTSSLVNVTFQVDMSNVTVNPIGVFIVGSFQNPPFTAGLDQMTDQGGGVWTFTTAIAAGTTVQYKYLNGPNFSNEETVPSNCGVDNGFGGFDRQWVVGTSDETIPLHCFSSCVTCDTPPVNVTFQVDMSNEVVDPAGVHIAGSFQGWDAAATPMTDQGGGVWSYTIALTPGETVQYKFINGNVWGQDESVPAECAVGFNREHLTGAADETVPLVCFASCGICNPPTADVTFQVDMSNETVDAAGVHLTGSFNGFDPAATPMTDMGGGIWEVTLTLDQGSAYQYKYLNGNTFAGEETVPMECGVDNGFGGYNREWTVGTSNEIIPVHCFSACGACSTAITGCTDVDASNYDPLATEDDGSCQYLVTFRVDMNQYPDPFTTVYVSGGFNGWDGTASPLTDGDGDGVWEGTYAMTNGDNAYKYQVDAWAVSEQFVGGEPCTADDGGGNWNRTVNIAGNTLLPVVCWESCAACPTLQVQVTFRVDMFNEVVDANGVHLVGDFNGWDATATPMTYLGYGIYEFSALFNENSTITFRFLNGNDYAGSEAVPMECGVDDGFGGYNRSLTIADVDAEYIVCFGACELCAGCTDPFSAEYNPFAGSDDGSCLTALVYGCTYMDADNYAPSATNDDGSCTFTLGSNCPEDLNNDGIINASDLLQFLAAFGLTCE